MPTYSIIIPTFNRIDVLPEVLAAVEAQQGAGDFELLVVDDGSTDGTNDWLAQYRPSIEFRWWRQTNKGPAAARNWGVTHARGDRVAFLGDDTVPCPGWLAAHRRAAESSPNPEKCAVIGYTAWHHRIRPTPFLTYINDFGLQFGYALLAQPNDVSFNFFYTSNLSLSRAELLGEPFDESFPYPAWEDIEASYRLKEKGLRLVYQSEAVTLHDHPTRVSRFMERQEKVGYSAIVFFQRHPQLGGYLGIGEGGVPAMRPALIRWPLRLLARTLQFLPLSTPWLWEQVLRDCYVQGLQRGWKERGKDAEESRS